VSDDRSRPAWMQALDDDDSFRPADALTVGSVFDAGLPLAVFTVVYMVTGQDMQIAIWSAVGAGVILAVVRLVRRDRLANVVAGFLGVAVAAWFANRTGNAEDVFLPGIIINIAYGSVYLISILVRWPLIGIVVEAITMRQGSFRRWRGNPRLMRAYTRASLLWVGMFAARLAVQVPLYMQGAEQLGWLATARLLMGVPLFAVVGYLTFLVVRPAYKEHRALLDSGPVPVGEAGRDEAHDGTEREPG